jgi:uncharacterized protein YndB with AHSA1/START domain
MMTMSDADTLNELELTVSRTFSAPRPRVFDAWLSPEMLSRFMSTPAGGSAPTRVANDPVSGGRFSIVMMNGEKEIPHAGTYIEIDPHSRLAFTWESPYSLDDSLVAIDFRDIESGGTELTLRQVKFRSEQARDGHREGWGAILANLSNMLG